MHYVPAPLALCPKTRAQAPTNVLSVTFPIRGLHASQKRSKVLFVAYAMRRKHSWRIRLAAYGARLERVLGSRPRGFKSPILRSFPGFEFSRSGIFVFGRADRVLLWRCAVCCGRGFSAWGSGILECRYDFQEGWFFAPVS